jgi:hypothetical protein
MLSKVGVPREREEVDVEQTGTALLNINFPKGFGVRLLHELK